MTETKTINNESEFTKKELCKLRTQYLQLEQLFINLESKYSLIKVQYNSIISKESYFKTLEFKFNEKEDQISKLTQEIDSIDSKNRRDAYSNDLKYERDINQIKYLYENNIAKVDNATQMEKHIPFLLDQIQSLQLVIKNYESEERRRVKEREILFEKEYSSMKKKMLAYIKEGQTKGRNVNNSQIDLQRKLNMMNHNQLLNELEFQSIQIETLLEERQNLERIIKEVKSDLNFHLELEKGILEKNRQLVEKVKTFSLQSNIEVNNPKGKSLQKNQNDNARHTPLSMPFSQSLSLKRMNMTLTFNKTMQEHLDNQSLSGFATQRKASVLKDKSKVTLQRELIQKQKEIENIKGKYDTLKNKMDSIQARYNNMLSLCEEALEKIANDPELIKTKDIYINLDDLKSCDFSGMPIDQKYSALTMLINYLLPLVNKEVLNEELNKKSIKKVERKFYLKKNISVKTLSPLINKSLSMFSEKKIGYKTPKEFFKLIFNNNTKNEKDTSPMKHYSILKFN